MKETDAISVAINMYDDGYNKGRAEVIEKVRRYINTHRYSNDDLIEFLEQLKEQNK